MRSLLSQFQTPTTPRRVVGFFGSGGPAGCPTGLITQSTSGWLILFEPILSIVDGAKAKRLADGCQCRFSVQTADTASPDALNPLTTRALLDMKIVTTLFYTHLPLCSETVLRCPGF
jgi:hypothetical protein